MGGGNNLDWSLDMFHLLESSHVSQRMGLGGEPGHIAAAGNTTRPPLLGTSTGRYKQLRIVAETGTPTQLTHTNLSNKLV